MTEESKQLYLTKDAELNRILQSVSDRLDRVEGLRGDPTFWDTTFQFPEETLTTNSILTASSASVAGFSTITDVVVAEKLHTMTL